MPKSKFCHLHLHTTYSFCDGVARPKDLIAEAVKNEMPAIAITDHGNMFGVIEFYEECLKQGIKPIIGCEIYLLTENEEAKNYHLVLLAETNEGYRNLIKIVSSGYMEHLGRRPQVTKATLQEHSSGLIALSACVSGEVQRKLIALGEAEAVKTAKEYLDIFGKNNFFLEAMNGGFPIQAQINNALGSVAQKAETEIVATGDVHYLKEEDWQIRHALICIDRGKLLSEFNEENTKGELHFRSEKEMGQILPEFKSAIGRTQEIADRCNIKIQLGNTDLPTYKTPDGRSTEEYLKALSINGLKKRLSIYKSNGINCEEKKYIDRLNYELNTIIKQKFDGYYLIVWDFVTYAKKNKIAVGMGRGSGGGSLVAYAMGITEIDPIKYNLLFERFISPQRVSPPDFDIDFSKFRRNEVVNYVISKYGQQNVAQISTIHRFQGKMAVRDVGRILGVSYQDVDNIAKLLPDPIQGRYTPIKQSLESEPKLKQAYTKNPTAKAILDMAQKLEGLARHVGTHAAGVVISNHPIQDYSPLYKKSAASETTIQYEMTVAEKVGLIKFDFLGLKTLSVFEKTLELINKDLFARHISSVADIPLDDTETFKTLSRGDTTGVFQLSSGGIRNLLQKINPAKIEDLAVVNALYRPGPLQAGTSEEYIKRRNKEKTTTYFHESLKPVLEETFGLIIFQEQVMKVSQVLAGFSIQEADALRHAIGKKKTEEMAKIKESFAQGCKKTGKIKKPQAEKIFEEIAGFADYAFNKAHSIGYSLLGYYTAYLKTHYPVEFLAALMITDENNTDKLITYIGEGKLKGIKILPPDLNLSNTTFTIVEENTATYKKAIRFGLGSIKGIGEAGVSAIMNARKEGPFIDLEDFCNRTETKGCNKATLEHLTTGGALDQIISNSKFHRAQVMEGIPTLLEKTKKKKNKEPDNQLTLLDIIRQEETDLPNVKQYTEEELMQQEKTSLGCYISKHPIEKYQPYLAGIISDTCNTALIGNNEGTVSIAGYIESFKKKQSKRNSFRYAIFTLEDHTGRIEVFVPSKVFKSTENILDELLTSPVLIKGKLEKQEFEDTHDEEGTKTIKLIMASVEPLLKKIHIPKEQEVMVPKNELLKECHIYIDAHKTSIEEISVLGTIIDKHPGKQAIFCHIEIPSHSKITLTTKKKITYSNEFEQDLMQLSGISCSEKEN